MNWRGLLLLPLLHVIPTYAQDGQDQHLDIRFVRQFSFHRHQSRSESSNPPMQSNLGVY